jgi:hypothetical protein
MRDALSLIDWHNSHDRLVIPPTAPPVMGPLLDAMAAAGFGYATDAEFMARLAAEIDAHPLMAEPRPKALAA